RASSPSSASTATTTATAACGRCSPSCERTPGGEPGRTPGRQPAVFPTPRVAGIVAAMHTVTIPTTPTGTAPAVVVSADDVTRRYGEGDTAVDALGGVS